MKDHKKEFPFFCFAVNFCFNYKEHGSNAPCQYRSLTFMFFWRIGITYWNSSSVLFSKIVKNRPGYFINANVELVLCWITVFTSSACYWLLFCGSYYCKNSIQSGCPHQLWKLPDNTYVSVWSSFSQMCSLSVCYKC